MKKEDLKRLGTGFYVDKNRSLYVDVKEFMTAHNLPDRAEVREALLEHIEQEFAPTEVTELSDEQ